MMEMTDNNITPVNFLLNKIKWSCKEIYSTGPWSRKLEWLPLRDKLFQASLIFVGLETTRMPHFVGRLLALTLNSRLG